MCYITINFPVSNTCPRVAVPSAVPGETSFDSVILVSLADESDLLGEVGGPCPRTDPDDGGGGGIFRSPCT